MKLDKTYKFEQFSEAIISPECDVNIITDEQGIIHLDVVFTSEQPNRGVYLGVIDFMPETTPEIKAVIDEKLKEYEIE